MKRYYVVDDDDNQVSWSAKTDKAEFFRSMSAAQNRARDLAECSPGVLFYICEAVSCIQAPVGTPVSKRL